MMGAVLVDSNVLLDVITRDPIWESWAAQAIADAGEQHLLVINPVIYSEVSAGFDRIEDLDEVVPAEDFRRDSLPREAAYLAGQAFRD